MQRIGDVVLASIKARIGRAVDINDNPAPPLKQNIKIPVKGGLLQTSALSRKFADRSYRALKVRKYGGKPIRDWWRTGGTMRSLLVLRAQPGEVKLGPSNEYARFRVMMNNRRWPQWGVSPTDRQVLVNSVRAVMAEAVKSTTKAA